MCTADSTVILSVCMLSVCMGRCPLDTSLEELVMRV